MTELVESILKRVSQCSPEEQRLVYEKLRETIDKHPLEVAWGCSAEDMLTAIQWAPELTQRMLKGVIADAAFRMYVVPQLKATNWEPVKFESNELYDHKLDDGVGDVTVQVKLQRSARGGAVCAGPRSRTWPPGYFTVEVQKTRTGKKKKRKGASGEGEEAEESAEMVDTRPYAFGDFDILAVSMWPSTRDWKDFRYTVGRWLIARSDEPSNIAVMQPLSPTNNDVWTNDFNTAVAWLRGNTERSIKPPYEPPPPKGKRRRKKTIA